MQETCSNTTAVVTQNSVQNNNNNNNKVHHRQSHEKNGHVPNGTVANGVHIHSQKSHRKSVDKVRESDHDHKHIERHTDKQKVNHSYTNGTVVGAGTEEVVPEPEPKASRKREKKELDKERENAEYMQKLESDIKKLRLDLQSSRNSEQELRIQVGTVK